MSTISAGQVHQYGEKQALEAIFRKTQSPAAGTIYMHLSTDAGTGVVDNTWVLISSGALYGATSYTPQAFSNANAASSASPSVFSNSGTITYGPFTSSPGTTINWGFVGDSATPGSANFIASFKLTTPRTPISGDSLQAAAAAFTCQV